MPEPEPPGGVSSAERHRWCDCVQSLVAEGELTPTALALAYVIAFQFLNGKSGLAWPTQQTLGRRLSLGERQIRTLLRDLETARLIGRRSRGYRKSDFIWLRFDRPGLAISETQARYRRWLHGSGKQTLKGTDWESSTPWSAE